MAFRLDAKIDFSKGDFESCLFQIVKESLCEMCGDEYRFFKDQSEIG